MHYSFLIAGCAGCGREALTFQQFNTACQYHKKENQDVSAI